MKCADHPHEDAVGQCGSCLKGLCSTCSAVFSPPACGSCVAAHNAFIARSFYQTLGVMAMLFVGAIVLTAGSLPVQSILIISLAAAFFLPGWQFLGRYVSSDGNYWHGYARLLTVIVHIAGAITIGFIVGPIYLYNAWKELSVVQATKQLLAEQTEGTVSKSQ